MPKSHIQNYLLFDASAIIHFFYEKEKYAPVLDYLLRRKEGNQSFFYIPCFCIAEVKNTFAKLRHRLKLISQEKYDEMLNVFTEDWIHDRKFLYPYYLNRYHNLNTDDIVKIEHTTKTEYHIKDAKDDYKY